MVTPDGIGVVTPDKHSCTGKWVEASLKQFGEEDSDDVQTDLQSLSSTTYLSVPVRLSACLSVCGQHKKDNYLAFSYS